MLVVHPINLNGGLPVISVIIRNVLVPPTGGAKCQSLDHYQPPHTNF